MWELRGTPGIHNDDRISRQVAPHPPQIESGGFPGGLKSIAALPRRAMITLPRTNLSIFVLRKQSNASSGLQTTGSFSLKDVLRTIGMPVRSRKLSINL